MRIINRRAFVGTMGALGTAAVLGGCSPESESVEGEAPATPAVNWAPTAVNKEITPLIPESSPVIYTEEEIEHILNNPAVVTEPFVNEDGTTVSPAHQMLRNRINRNGIGYGSMITKDHQFDLWPSLFSEEEAQAYIEMPMYTKFTAADFAKESGRTEEDCLAVCNAIADRGLLRRVYKNGVPYFNTLGSEYGYYESYVQHLDRDFLIGKDTNEGLDAGLSFLDSGTSMYRTLPVDLDVVVDGNYTQWDDWRDIFKRNDVFAVAPCVCRCRQMIQEDEAENVQEIMAQDMRRDCKHPVETCITTGEQAEYFIEIDAGREITAEEGIAIMEDAVEQGLIIETVYTKAAENICLCHADCCLNVGAVRLLNGGPAVENYSNFYLAHQREECVKCGACAARCPMFSITMDEEGYPVVDSACVRCGQCATVCPQGVRGLVLKDEKDLPYIPEDLLEDYIVKARNRIGKGYLFDITSQGEMAAAMAESETAAMLAEIMAEIQ